MKRRGFLGTLLAALAARRLQISPEGAPPPEPDSPEILSVSETDGWFMVRSAEGTEWISQDGITWTPRVR